MKKYHYLALTCFLFGWVGNIFTTLAQTPTDTNPHNNAYLNERVDFKGNIAQRIENDFDYATLAKILHVSGLQTKLQSAGPYTVFAPSEDAFNRLPAGKLDSLLIDQEASATLIGSFIVLGKLGRKEITRLLAAGKGKATLKSLNGTILQLTADVNKNLVITDSHGFTAFVNRFDVRAENGVINIISNVLSFP